MSDVQEPQGTASDGTAQSARRRSRSRSPRKELTLEAVKIGFLGAGKMAQSITDGLLSHGNVKPDQLFVAAPSSENLEFFRSKGIKISKRLIEIIDRHDCDIVISCIEVSSRRPSEIESLSWKTSSRSYQRRSSSCTRRLESRRRISCPLSSGNDFASPSRFIESSWTLKSILVIDSGHRFCGVDTPLTSKRLDPLLRTLLSSIGKLEHVPEDLMDAAVEGGPDMSKNVTRLRAMSATASQAGLSSPWSEIMASEALRSGIHSLNEKQVGCSMKAAIKAALEMSQKPSQ